MSNELLDIFREEVADYITELNEGLLKLEMSDHKLPHDDLFKEMNRMAHSMKGAARAVGFEMVEKISQYMEEIFHAALHKKLHITPGMGDTLYDGIDLIQHRLDEQDIQPSVKEEILKNLSDILTNTHNIDENQLRRTDSAEIHIITDEILSVEEPSKTQTSPNHAIRETISDDLLNIFWLEVEDHLKTLNQGLLNVEMLQYADKTEHLREMNRVAHSMKGAARAVDHLLIEQISHLIEEVFEQTLDGTLDLSPTIADKLYDGLDLIKESLDGRPIPADLFSDFITQMSQITLGTERASRAIPLKGNDPVPPAEETPEIEIPAVLLTSSTQAVGSPTILMRPAEDSLRVSVHKLDQMMADTGELLTAKLQGENRHRMLKDLQREHIKWQREWRSARSAYIRLARRLQDNPDNMSAELTTLFHFLETNEDYLTRSNRELTRLQQVLSQDNMHLSALAEQLQSDVSSLRMMPFETIVSSFQRVARDIARDIGKQLHLEIRGVSVEIDKTVLDALKDPLMHLLRNAIDHGLEDPATRVRLGKDAIGHVSLAVQQRGNEIVITIQDDGRGFDVNLIRHKAIERSIISTQEAQMLSDEDIHLLVFSSGLSTSQTVTALSGRGLGMDIVRTQVENLRGRVAVSSVRNAGTTISLHVPVSLTRLSVVTMRVGDEYYAIPSNMVERMETFPTDFIFTAEGQEVLNINGRPMPLFSLGAVLGSPILDKRRDMIKVIAIQIAERSVAFEVDELFNEIEIVLKPLGEELANAPFVSGAAILGSGNVIIVLDANDLVRRATGTTYNPNIAQVIRSQEMEARPLRILVIDDSITTRTLEKNILEAVGFDVHVAIDGAEAWQRLPDIQPDLIVSDVEMPKMNGLEFTRLLKGSEETRAIPIILLTSLGKPEQREAGLNAGADAYLIKSRFDQGELLETIERFTF